MNACLFATLTEHQLAAMQPGDAVYCLGDRSVYIRTARGVWFTPIPIPHARSPQYKLPYRVHRWRRDKWLAGQCEREEL